jgi:hypothetical protein
MAAVLHGSARTTSKKRTWSLAARYGLNPKMVAKWLDRRSTIDAAMGPRDPHSTVLSAAEEPMVLRSVMSTSIVASCGWSRAS